MASEDLHARVIDALRTVIDPEMHVDLVTAKMIKECALDGRDLKLDVELTTPACPLKDVIERDVRAALAKVEGLGRVGLVFSARVRSAPALAASGPIPGLRNIVAIAAGKGGVGKSTVATNVAVALARDGARTGILDADIHGPSVAKMFDLGGAKPEGRGNRILPIEVGVGAKHPLKVMSMAFFLDDSQPVVWRGPMLHKALQQFLHDVDWGELDYLVLDLPPGTGDVQISLTQLVPLSGALLVTTPQDVALLDVRKAAVMFAKVNVPILGVIENMGAFECPGCHEVHSIFGEGGGESLAKELGVPFLGRIPLHPSVREGGDAGLPIVASKQPGAAGEALLDCARKLAGQVSVRAAQGGYAVELPVL